MVLVLCCVIINVIGTTTRTRVARLSTNGTSVLKFSLDNFIILYLITGMPGGVETVCATLALEEISPKDSDPVENGT